MSQEGYIHGYSDAEAERLITQAEFLAPWVFDGVTLASVTRLLEVGVGVGAETRLLRARWPQLHVVGVDVSPLQLQYARHVLAADIAAAQVTLVRASGTALPLASGCCDAAFLCWLLEHVPDPAALLRECARVVAPGGRVYITEVYNRSLHLEPAQPIIERYWEAFNETQLASGGHPHIGARLGELAAAAGLEAIEHRFVPVIGDARDPAARSARLRYFESLLRSGEPQVRAAGNFPVEELPELWAAFDRVVAAPDALMCYTMAKLQARVPALA
jgi:ubiquinone/menaquinone biosynthesis C-methylase UbiE